MTRARDVANVLSAATSLATDTETAAAISSHMTASNGHVSFGNTAGRPSSPIIGQIHSNTQTGFMEIYSGETYGWEQIGGIASSVSGVTATNQGTGRGYNNGQASISFTPGTILGRSYTVTSSPDGITATGSSSPITITGLSSDTDYTYTVVATNNYGASSASSASSAVRARTVPKEPAITSVTAGNLNASVAFTTPFTGGSAITGYTVTSSPGNLTATGSSSPLVVSGLTQGTSYTFTVQATNVNGNSISSDPSSSVTAITVPGAPTSVTATAGAAGSGQATISFTAPASNGGSAITQYRVTSSPGNITATGASTSITISGLTLGSSYTFTVEAQNAAGYGAASSASNSITASVVLSTYTYTYSGVTGAGGNGTGNGKHYGVDFGHVNNGQGPKIFNSSGQVIYTFPNAFSTYVTPAMTWDSNTNSNTGSNAEPNRTYTFSTGSIPQLPAGAYMFQDNFGYGGGIVSCTFNKTTQSATPASNGNCYKVFLT